MQFENPAIDLWVIISAIWFTAQVLILIPFYKTSYKSLLWPIAIFLFAITVGRFFLTSFYWPFLLFLFPAIVLISIARSALSKKWKRSWMLPTILLAGIAIPSFAITKAYAFRREGNLSLAERVLKHGFRAGATSALNRIEGEPGSIEVYREILRKVELRIVERDGHRIYQYGPVMVAASIVEPLLENGDPMTDMPLILETMRRVESTLPENDTSNMMFSFYRHLNNFFSGHDLTGPSENSSAAWSRFWEAHKNQFSASSHATR